MQLNLKGWKENGFADPPVLGYATGTEKLYRVWGGDPQRKWGNTDKTGVCFTLQRASSRWDAELLYAVMEYKNPVLWITEFSVPTDTPLWIGKIHPGDPRALLGKVSGDQVFIEREYLGLVKEVSTQRLHNDLGSSEVYTGPTHPRN